MTAPPVEVRVGSTIRLVCEHGGVKIIKETPTQVVHTGIFLPWAKLAEALAARDGIIDPSLRSRAFVCRLADLSGGELDKLIRENRFPKPTLWRGEQFWTEADVRNWLVARRNARGGSR